MGKKKYAKQNGKDKMSRKKWAGQNRQNKIGTTK